MTIRTVLLVEDEPWIRAMTADMLAECGYTVFEAENGSDAIALLSEHDKLDILVTDVNLPGALDGIELSEIASRDLPHLKVVLTSGSGLPEAARLPDRGSYLPKPFRPDELRAALAA
jgi:CheY-like chemotaxis protein